MAAIELSCPECSATLRMAKGIPDGKKVRCPKCSTMFRPDGHDGRVSASSRRRAAHRDEDDYEDEAPPRRGSSRQGGKKKSDAGLVVGVAVAAVLLLAGVGVAVALLWPGAKADPQDPKVTPPVAQNQLKPAPLQPKNLALAPVKQGNARLDVGQMAMEIEGEDIDGQPFKLSDYRGKVVVLDFWGHW
jgi:predicted Zn finger-like uncharacterized protein